MGTTARESWAADPLPTEPTSFVGRRADIAEVKKLLAGARVVTLTGVGGVGKTRLSLRVAAEVRRAFADGLCFVDLAPLKDASLLPYTVADALGIDSAPSTRAQLDVIIDVLRDRQILLLLDNCEHVVDAAASVVTAVVRANPGVRVLATSRQPLGVAGEHIKTVMPLPVPSPDDIDHLPPQAAALQFPSLGLFAERAAAVTGFELTEENWRDAALLCTRLDGLPLAIEMAAVSSRVMTAGQMLERFDDWHDGLSGYGRTAPPRHRSLSAVVGWSYQLCSRRERLLWSRASVFAGPFGLEAAEGVCAGEGLAAAEVLPAVGALVEKSVLVREEHHGRVRYRLLESLARFGRERLRESGAQEPIRERHGRWYVQLAEEMAAGWFGPDQVGWSQRLRVEHADLRAAFDGCLTARDSTAALRMAAALRYYWLACGHLTEGRLWTARALELDDERRAENGGDGADPPGTPHREGAPDELRARALFVQGALAAMQADQAVADPALTECRELARKLDDRYLDALATAGQALAAETRGDLPTAAARAEESLTHRAYAADTERCLALVVLAMTCGVRGDYAQAIDLSAEVVALCDRHGEGWYRSWALLGEALARFRSGDPAMHTARARELLRIKREFHDGAGVSMALMLVTWTTIAAGDYERGAVLVGICRRQWHRVGVESSAAVYQPEQFEERCRQALGEAAYQAAFTRGVELEAEAALDFAAGADDDAGPEPAAAGEESPLTPRETEVAALIAQGLSNKEVAARLVISQRTAEGHVVHILTKLGFTSRTQIATWVATHQQG